MLSGVPATAEDMLVPPSKPGKGGAISTPLGAQPSPLTAEPDAAPAIGAQPGALPDEAAPLRAPGGGGDIGYGGAGSGEPAADDSTRNQPSSGNFGFDPQRRE
ncbi:MAG: hypothetical protein AAF367_12585 [Pseudomonadota bacterium]